MADLDSEIEAAIGKLLAGFQPKDVLREFAGKIKTQTVERIEKVCAGCGDEDALCFQCKVEDTIGEQAALAAPLMIPKLMEMAKRALASAASRRKAAKESTGRPAAARGPGRQNF